MSRALLLNADWTPLHFISDIDAIVLFYKGAAEVVTGIDGRPAVWNEKFCSPSTSIDVPATMRLLHRVNKRQKPPRFRKKVLFNRDDWKCQYCNVRLGWHNIEVEHVLPRSRGGPTTWLNCVAACKPCNKRKRDQTPEEAGMPLLRRPVTPSSLHFWDSARSSEWHESWDAFIPRQAS